MSVYNRQLIATEDMVVMIPGTVLHQPEVSMTEDGHNTTRKSVLPIVMRCHTPQRQSRTNTIADTINPTVPPITAVPRTVIEFQPPMGNLLSQISGFIHAPGPKKPV
jgi:hypothetical protein